MYGDYPIAAYINIIPEPKVVVTPKQYGQMLVKRGKRK